MVGRVVGSFRLEHVICLTKFCPKGPLAGLVWSLVKASSFFVVLHKGAFKSSIGSNKQYANQKRLCSAIELFYDRLIRVPLSNDVFVH